MVHRVISFNQNERLKTYIEMNNKLRIEVKKWFGEGLFQTN